MINPLELLKSKHQELLNEYARVYNISSGESIKKDGSNKRHTKFEFDKHMNMGEIKKEIDEYSATIDLLESLNEYEYLKDKK